VKSVWSEIRDQFQRDSTQPIRGNIEKLKTKNIKENEESQTRNDLQVVVGDENKISKWGLLWMA
jgi:hypothetical protein